MRDWALAFRLAAQDTLQTTAPHQACSWWTAKWSKQRHSWASTSHPSTTEPAASEALGVQMQWSRNGHQLRGKQNTHRKPERQVWPETRDLVGCHPEPGEHTVSLVLQNPASGHVPAGVGNMEDPGLRVQNEKSGRSKQRPWAGGAGAGPLQRGCGRFSLYSSTLAWTINTALGNFPPSGSLVTGILNGHVKASCWARGPASAASWARRSI